MADLAPVYRCWSNKQYDPENPGEGKLIYAWSSRQAAEIYHESVYDFDIPFGDPETLEVVVRDPEGSLSVFHVVSEVEVRFKGTQVDNPVFGPQEPEPQEDE